MPNPSLRLDPGLAIVVIEFRDGEGKVRETIPTQAQLDAYRSSQLTRTDPVSVPGSPGAERGSAGPDPAAIDNVAVKAEAAPGTGVADTPRSTAVKDSETDAA